MPPASATHTVADRLSELAGQVDGAVVALQARHAAAVADGDAPELDVLSGEFEAVGTDVVGRGLVLPRPSRCMRAASIERKSVRVVGPCAAVGDAVRRSGDSCTAICGSTAAVVLP